MAALLLYLALPAVTRSGTTSGVVGDASRGVVQLKRGNDETIEETKKANSEVL